MNNDNKKEYERVLSIYPTKHGYSFAVLEGSQLLLDWGSVQLRTHKNVRSLVEIRDQIDKYEVNAIVIEDHEGVGSYYRPQRVRNLLDAIEVLGTEQSVGVYKYSRADVRSVFEMFGASTKYEIATVINSHSPTNELRMPRVRKPWMDEDRRMGVFDAISFGMTHYYLIK